ncbi:MAG: nitrate ABC transporter permease, partial [Eisenbergiella sp.]
MWKDFPDRLKKAAVIFFWLLVWQLACLKMDNAILLVGPVETLKTFASQLFTLSFWQAVGFSFGRICLGFFLAFFAGLTTGALSCRFRLLGDFLELPIQLMKAIPVASFVILALIWTGSGNLSVLISFAVVFPMIHVS